ncbi:MAG: thiamine diphosphokinase [Sphaerochaetaceae bacterium]|nr:thiamine diphosphokinase [Sphaerochaetaceae bacterium]MDC7236577.1 thiamine diphosphokinase [Sphaerochaetaceae bacterium]MDC7244038.1 thiamine diphosphokinase [Sphaerochaetaceae bacterium]MDC7248737.1 thiamine diphosphokinase [Sphaerochaetaceae bacterium]
MRAIIVTNGNAPLSLPSDFAKDSDLIIAADGGLEIVEILGLDCDIAIGDFDSLKNIELLNNIKYQRYEKDKDFSDTELAIAYARDQGCDEYILLGGGEGRMDHLLGIWGIFKNYGPPICWLTRKDALYLVQDKKNFKTSIGETVSIINSILGSSALVNCDNLKWPLKNFVVTSNHFSLSNEATKGILHVECKEGSVFVSFLNPREEV